MTNQQFIEQWIDSSKTKKNSRLSSTPTTLYSYNTVIAEKVNNIIIVSTRKISQTTSCHTNICLKLLKLKKREFACMPTHWQHPLTSDICTKALFEQAKLVSKKRPKNRLVEIEQLNKTQDALYKAGFIAEARIPELQVLEEKTRRSLESN